MEHEDWQHPSQVLDRPRPDLVKLLEACRQRRKRSRGKPRNRADSAVFKVERAARIAAAAREKREKMRGCR